MSHQTALRSLKQGKNVIGVLGATILGILFPLFAQWLQPLITPIVVFLIYSSIHDVQIRRINLNSYFPVLLAALFIAYIGLPTISVGLAEILRSEGTLVGLFVVMAAPSTAGSAIIWTQLSDGDVFLSTIGSTLSILLAPAASSILLLILLHKQVQSLLPSIAVKLGSIILGALLLKAFIPDESIEDVQLRRASQFSIVILVYTGVATSNLGTLSIMDAVAVGGVVITLLLCGLLLAIVSSAVINTTRDQILPLFFTATFKNLGISLLIAVSFPVDGVVPVIVIYYVLQQVAGALITDFTVLSSDLREARTNL